MKRQLLLAVLLMGGLLLCACVQHDTVVEPEKTFEERLLDGAQPLAENITGEEPRKLSLESVHYGSFSSPSAQELCALFKYESTVHVEGLDRTLAVIYTVEDLKVVASKDLQADEVQIEYLPSPEGSEVILCFATVTNHGFSTYHIELFSIRESQWGKNSGIASGPERARPLLLGGTDRYAGGRAGYLRDLYLEQRDRRF